MYRYPLHYLIPVVALGLAACGDDNSSETGTDGATTSSSTTASTTNSTSNSGTNGTSTTASTTMTTATTNEMTSSTTEDVDSSSETTDPTGGKIECPYTPIEGDITIGFEEVASGFNQPLLVVGDPVELDVLYVVQKGGQIKRLEPGQNSAPADNWLQLNVAAEFEGGLLGFAFHPDYASNGLIYTLHSDQPSSWVITEFTVEDGTPNMGSARLVFGTEQPASNHNGGMIQFGPDGMLYISVGDGGPQGNACGNGQNGDTHHGSILRIDPAADGTPDMSTACGNCPPGQQAPYLPCTPSGGFDYTIPDDNPFVGDNQVRDEIYAYGFRNPWRFSFDYETEDLYVGDVGQGGWEEVDSVQAGANYGWGDMEGNHCHGGAACDTSAAPGAVNGDGFTAPIAEYARSGGRCSITGLGVYRSCEVPSLGGIYFYADLCSTEVWGVRYDGNSSEVIGPVGTVPASPGPFGGGYNAYGDVFIATAPYLGGNDPGRIFRITATAN